jgi:hypothetical protein
MTSEPMPTGALQAECPLYAIITQISGQKSTSLTFSFQKSFLNLVKIDLKIFAKLSNNVVSHLKKRGEESKVPFSFGSIKKLNFLVPLYRKK